MVPLRKLEDSVTRYDAQNAQGEAVPAYSGTVARQWGNRPGPDDAWITAGKLHLVKAATPITTLADLDAALLAGNPVTVASNQGFTMMPLSDGFHHPSGSWSHGMCFVMCELGDDKIPKHYAINNNWGDVHGHITDFRTGEAWPTGILRVRPEVALSMLRANDSLAYTGVSTWVVPNPSPIHFF